MYSIFAFFTFILTFFYSVFDCSQNHSYKLLYQDDIFCFNHFANILNLLLIYHILKKLIPKMMQGHFDYIYYTIISFAQRMLKQVNVQALQKPLFRTRRQINRRILQLFSVWYHARDFFGHKYGHDIYNRSDAPKMWTIKAVPPIPAPSKCMHNVYVCSLLLINCRSNYACAAVRPDASELCSEVMLAN